ncbi:hypothetical protein Hanom_Chr09g00835971 [Helianthus anomalus]
MKIVIVSKSNHITIFIDISHGKLNIRTEAEKPADLFHQHINVESKLLVIDRSNETPKRFPKLNLQN